MDLLPLNVRHISGCYSNTRTKKYTRRVGMNFCSCLSLIIDRINCMIGSEVKTATSAQSLIHPTLPISLCSINVQNSYLAGSKSFPFHSNASHQWKAQDFNCCCRCYFFFILVSFHPSSHSTHSSLTFPPLNPFPFLCLIFPCRHF